MRVLIIKAAVENLHNKLTKNQFWLYYLRFDTLINMMGDGKEELPDRQAR